MYCSTCGARVPDGRTNCQSCGAVVARMSVPPALPAHPSPAAMLPGGYAEPVGICPRCGYRGQSISYFSRGGHVAALVLATVVTAGAMGAGGILYYLVRRDHRVCPRCGEGWGKHGAYAVALAGPNASGMRLASGPDPVMAAGGGTGKRVFSWALFLFAAFMIMVGFGEAELGMVLFGAMSGTGGWLLHRSAGADRERRREALIQGLQLPVLQLAGKKGGRLTVTDVATELGWPMNRAEKVLNSLEDGMRVMSDITDDGVIVYDFLEIRAAQLPASPPPASRVLSNGGSGSSQSALSA